MLGHLFIFINQEEAHCKNSFCVARLWKIQTCRYAVVLDIVMKE